MSGRYSSENKKGNTMPRLSKRTKPEPPPRTDAFVGRGLKDQDQKQDEENADILTEGQFVQYFQDGWRYGQIDRVPVADEPKYGQVQVNHAMTGRIWVHDRAVKTQTQTGEE